jgi:hypothetical protein
VPVQFVFPNSAQLGVFLVGWLTIVLYGPKVRARSSSASS